MFVCATDAPVIEVGEGVTRQILARDPQLMLVRVGFKKGAIGYIHSHPHRQVTFVEKGRFEATMGTEKKTIQAGDSYYAPPDVPHGVVALEDGVLLDIFTPQREDFIK
jgi:quercetin dioxygenase-like cupin family protein